MQIQEFIHKHSTCNKITEILQLKPARFVSVYIDFTPRAAIFKKRKIKVACRVSIFHLSSQNPLFPKSFILQLTY